MIEDLTQVISTVGFPIGVAMYTLVRLEKTVNSMTQAINEMSKAIIKIGGGDNE